MDRQTLRDWVHRFNASGPEGLFDTWTEGFKPRLSEEQLAQFAKIVEAGPDREIDGVVRWRRIDLKRVITERFTDQPKQITSIGTRKWVHVGQLS